MPSAPTEPTSDYCREYGHQWVETGEAPHVVQMTCRYCGMMMFGSDMSQLVTPEERDRLRLREELQRQQSEL